MDPTERLAKQYLESLALGPVDYEPDGNVPPDFLVDGRIAVEIRRLNQSHEHPDGTYEGLEQRWIPLWQRLRKHLSSLGPSVLGESWYVCVIDFSMDPVDRDTFRTKVMPTIPHAFDRIVLIDPRDHRRAFEA